MSEERVVPKEERERNLFSTFLLYCHIVPLLKKKERGRKRSYMDPANCIDFLSYLVYYITMRNKTKSEVCGAKKRQGEGYCQRPAGWGTQHPGLGVCKLHGGSAKQMYTKAITPAMVNKTFKDRAKELSNDPELLTLNREIGIARTLLENLQDMQAEGKEMVAINMVLDTVGKLVERHHRIEIQRKGLVQAAVINALMDSWEQAITEIITDPDIRLSLRKKVKDLSHTKLAPLMTQQLLDQAAT